MEAYSVTISGPGVRGTYVTRDIETVISDLRTFTAEAEYAGGEVRVEVVDMSDEQIEALGEFEGF